MYYLFVGVVVVAAAVAFVLMKMWIFYLFFQMT